jgi:LacI family transcriptional regulator
MVTSEEVARLAGVSRATVSRVLNGSANVSEETRKRIYAAITTLGYGSNVLTRAAMQDRSQMIALALFGSDDGLNLSRLTGTQYYFYLELLRYIEREVAKRAYDIFLLSHPYDAVATIDDPEANYIMALQRRQVEGVITLALRSNDPRIQGLCRSSIPAVFIDSVFQGSHATYVRSDYLGGARQATEYLLQLGHRRIAFIAGDTLALTGTERLLGYQQAMAHAGLIVDPHLLRTSGWDARDAYQAMMTLLSERRDFTAVFASSDMIALGVLRALRKQGLRVPEDVSIIGFDDIDQSTEADPALTTIHQDKQAISEGAISLLFQLIKGEEAVGPLIVPTRLVVRESTRSIV